MSFADTPYNYSIIIFPNRANWVEKLLLATPANLFVFFPIADSPVLPGVLGQLLAHLQLILTAIFLFKVTNQTGKPDCKSGL